MKMGDLTPSFCLIDKDGKEICLHDFTNKWVVFYFYLRDNTSDCSSLKITPHSRLP
ncbi:MAG: redoxin domain-containing protein [Methanomicrobia archaeon]|nr:redoxin domain-containing protein [Methanomicrobia archaeon]